MTNIFKYFSILIIFSSFLFVSYRFDLLGFRTNFTLGFVGFKKNVAYDKKYQQELKAEKDKNKILAEEINKLKNELQTREDFTKEYIEAQVVGFDEDKLTINRGSSSQLFPKQKVIIGQSLVGEVSLVEKNRSQVTLLNNPAIKINCTAQKDGRNIWGLLTADSNGNTMFTKIMQDKKVEKKDKIYCEGFYAGDVKSILRNSTDWFYSARIARAASAENLDVVWIVVSK
jgi:cell shape-determining protein MreC